MFASSSTVPRGGREPHETPRTPFTSDSRPRWVLRGCLAGLGLCLLAAPFADALPRAERSANAAGPHIPIRPYLEQSRTLSYPYDQVWPTAIRYLRVDRKYAVDEKDEDAGFIVFSFPAGGGKGTGSLEMFQTEDASGRPSVRIMANTQAGPVHLPNAILDGIDAKLRKERGLPAPPPSRDEDPKPPPPKDDLPDDGSVPIMPPGTDPN